MLKSRKLFNALAVTGLLTLGSVGAYAQTCNAFSTNIGLRPEGLTENVGDITVSGCSAPLPADFSVLIQMPATFAITNGTGAAQQPTITGLPGALIVPSYPAALPNAISFQVTGATGTGFTISGIRVNVNAAVVGGFATGGQVTASMIVSTGSTIISVTNPNPVVGTVLPVSLTFSTVGGNDFSVSPLPAARSLATCVDRSGVVGAFRFVETFAGTLRTQTGANSEDGGVANSATTGTQLKINIGALPAGISLYLPIEPFTTGRTALTLVSGVGTTPATGLTTTYTPQAGDTAYAGAYGAVSAGDVYYEVTGASPATVDSLMIPFVVSYTPGPGVGIGSVATRGGLGPQAATEFPRFADVTTNANAFSTNTCSTTLLWPYVTTDAGFDTGIAITNTSADPLGTAQQSGTCSLTPYGTLAGGGTVPAAGTSPAINAGRTWAFSLTDSAVFADGARLGSGFNGYLIASCGFQLGHGYAFISTYGLAGSNAIAQGYLALVIPSSSRVALLGESGVETLGH